MFYLSVSTIWGVLTHEHIVVDIADDKKSKDGFKNVLDIFEFFVYFSNWVFVVSVTTKFKPPWGIDIINWLPAPLMCINDNNDNNYKNNND
jgi:hypothetical protein